MSYFSVLGLDREPFSSSPDPSFLYLSEEHKAALCRIQIAIALRRGLSVLMGDVGTGKTTLSRKLARVLSEDGDISFYMILNPYFSSDRQFLHKLADLFHVSVTEGASSLECMEGIERFLFRRGVEEGKTVVLLIDESQILPDFVLEILRILLNYETNDYKILQLVLVGQLELLPRLSKMPNLWDRIALKYVLNPLGHDEVREMIRFRLRQAGYRGAEPLFEEEAVDLIYRQTQGYPRRMALLCHNALEWLVMHERRSVTADAVRELIRDEVRPVLESELGLQPVDAGMPDVRAGV